MKTRSPMIFFFCLLHWYNYTETNWVTPRWENWLSLHFEYPLRRRSPCGVFFLFFLFFKSNQKPKQQKTPKGKKKCKRSETKKTPNTVPFIMASLALYNNDSAVQLLWQCGYNDIKILTLYRIALQNSPPTEKRRQHLVLLCMSGCPTPFIFPCIFCDYEEV